MVCQKCQNTIPDGANQCPYCGAVFAPQPYDPNWRKGLRSTGGYVTGMVFGIILLAVLFPLNALLGFGGNDWSNPNPVAIVFMVLAVGSLAGGLVLLITSIKKLKKAKLHNAELIEAHKADIEAEKRQKELAIKQQQTQKQQAQEMANQQPTFNAGTTGKIVFQLNGTLSSLQVYEDRVIHIAKTTARSYVAGKFFNGTKEYFYDDLINVQFREATKFVNGYLQFDYAGAVNISKSGFGGTGGNYNSENSFIFDANVSAGTSIMPGEDPIKAANRIVSDAYRYIHGRIMEEKKAKKTGYAPLEQSTTTVSAADELKKYNELLQSGAITQEEFDDIKKKLL